MQPTLQIHPFFRIVNFFYKNVVCIGVLWWFQIYNAWSSSLYVDKHLNRQCGLISFTVCWNTRIYYFGIHSGQLLLLSALACSIG